MFLIQPQPPSVNTMQAYGVSQGHFTIRDLPTQTAIGTSSLGSCFAFIAISAEKNVLILAHIQNESETDDFGLLDFGIPKAGLALFNYNTYFIFVMGAVAVGSTQELSTKQRIKSMKESLRCPASKTKDLRTSKGTVVVAPVPQNSGSVKIYLPNNIHPTNANAYAQKNTAGGQAMDRGLGSQPMTQTDSQKLDQSGLYTGKYIDTMFALA